MASARLTLDRRTEARSKGHLARAWSRLLRKKIALACMTAIAVLYISGVFSQVVAPYGYTDQNLSETRNPPSLKHPFGTDRGGRDMFTRILWGIQNTVIITVVSMATGGLVIGVSLGLISGYFGGRIDALINRVGEVFSAFPEVLLIIILAATLKPRLLVWVRWLEDNTFLDGLVRTGIQDYVAISLALVAFGWFGMARIVRGQVLVLRETQYVEAARALGASTPRILFHHLLPNSISIIMVVVSSGMGALVFAEIVLSFLGLGIQPPRPSLGRMLLEGGNIGTLQNEWWMLLFPGAVAWLIILAWTLLGDALVDVFNPRTR
ncbi:MAG: ABC transporter permease [Chloroflexi bacterium]|nr:ABC transporter permease [Chloroflexota bacterium]